MSEKLGAGVIGLNIGEYHARGYWESPHVELRAVSALTSETLDGFRKKFPVVDTYQDMDELLARDDIQVGVEVLGIDFAEHVNNCIEAMSEVAGELGLLPE